MGQFNWTPPETDKVVDQKTAWTPPSTDKVVPDKKKVATVNVSSTGSSRSPDRDYTWAQEQQDNKYGPGFRRTDDDTTPLLPTTSRSKATISKPIPTKEQDRATLQEMHDKNWSNLMAKGYLLQLDSKQRNDLYNINNIAQKWNEGMSIRATTPQEIEAQKAMDSTFGKVKKSIAYVASEGLKGGEDVLKGGAWVVNHLNTGLTDTQLIPDSAWGGVDKFTDLGITPGQRDQIENNKGLGWGSVRTLGMLSNIAPAAVGGESVELPKTLFALQGFGQGVDTMNKVDPDHQLNPAVRDLFIAGNGVINGILMGDLKENVLSKPLQEKIVLGLTTEAMADAAEKGLTEDVFKESAKKVTDKFIDKVGGGLEKYFENTGRAAVDLSAIQTGNWALKKGVDLSADKPVFHASLGELMQGISDVVTKEAPVFGGVGAMLKGGKEAKTAKISNQISNLDNVINSADETPLGQSKKRVATEQKKELESQLDNLVKNEKAEEEHHVGTDNQVRTEEKETVERQQVAERPENTDKGTQAVRVEPEEDDKGLRVEDATKEQIAGTLDVGKSPEDGGKVGEGNPEPEVVTGQSEKEKTTGIKKAISESTRIEKNLPEVKLSPMMKDHEVLSRGKEQIESGKVQPEQVVNRILVQGGNYHHENEAPAMLYYGHQLARHEENLTNAIAESSEEERPALISNRQQLDDQIDRFTEANRINSNSWGKMGNIIQIEADQSFNPVNIRTTIRENYGGTIPKDVQARLDILTEQRDEAIRNLKEVTEKNIQQRGTQVVEKMRRSVISKSKEQLKSEAKDLLSDLRRAMKSDFSKMNAGIPIPTETLAVMGKLAVNYFQQGIKDFEGIANRIYEDLKDLGVDKGQVREYLSNYEPLREESRQRRLNLLGRKERSGQKQLETGEIRDRKRKPEITFKKDTEVLKAQQRVADVEYKLKQEKLKSYQASKSTLQRGLDRIIRWRRRIVLANPLTSLKLVSAAVSSPIMRTQRQLAGAVIRKVIPRIAEKATIEGNFNARTEFEYWKDVFNPKKFITDAAEIYKTGTSPLKKRFGKVAEEHYPGLDALQDTHMVIKAPVHNAAFEATMKYLYNWAADNNIDYTDPLVVKNFENQAIKEADYEIFQEDLKLGGKIRAMLGTDSATKLFDESKPDDVKRFLVRFMLPINLVPLNIARRIESYTFGTVAGAYRAVEAYRNGIENLTPEQANYIMKQLKNGSVGLAYYTLGMFASKSVLGGLWQKDDGTAKKSLPDRAAFNEMRINGVSIDKRLQHGMPLFLMQLGATTARVYNHYMDVPEDDPKYQQVLKSAIKAMMATQGTVAEEVPLINTPKELVESLSDPQARERLGDEAIRMTGAKLPQDLGLIKKPEAVDKKLRSISDDDGNKVNLSDRQFKQRKERYAYLLADKKKVAEWTKDFDDDVWNSDKEKEKRENLVDFMHSRGRSDKYIKEKLADMRSDRLNEYIQKQAVEESGEQIVPPQTKPKNKYSIK